MSNLVVILMCVIGLLGVMLWIGNDVMKNKK